MGETDGGGDFAVGKAFLSKPGSQSIRQGVGMSTALQTLVIVVVIGILASWLVTRYGRGWFGTRANDLTAALVGIAGAPSS